MDSRPAIDRLLEQSREGMRRATVEDLPLLVDAGALVVDTRPVEQRGRDGELPGALVVDRNVLEWRLDPTSPNRLEVADDPDRVVVVVCNEGYSSSLAADTLRRLGLRNATDLEGGFQAWRSAQPGSGRSRSWARGPGRSHSSSPSGPPRPSDVVAEF